MGRAFESRRNHKGGGRYRLPPFVFPENQIPSLEHVVDAQTDVGAVFGLRTLYVGNTVPHAEPGTQVYTDRGTYVDGGTGDDEGVRPLVIDAHHFVGIVTVDGGFHSSRGSGRSVQLAIRIFGISQVK